MIEQEIAVFERLQPELSQRYGSQYVAIYQGEVVAHRPDRIALVKQVYARFGAVPCFIEKADATKPRTVRMPSIRVVRRIEQGITKAKVEE